MGSIGLKLIMGKALDWVKAHAALLAGLAIVGLLVWFLALYWHQSGAIAKAAAGQVQAETALSLERSAHKLDIETKDKTITLVRAQRDKLLADQDEKARFADQIHRRVKERPQDEGPVPPVLLDTLRSLH